MKRGDPSKGEMEPVFLVGAAGETHVAVAAHAHHQHIHIVEAAQPVGGLDIRLLHRQLFHRFPGIENIPGGAPGVSAGGFDPFPGIVRPPAAGVEKDIPPAVRQRRPHPLVQQVPGGFPGPEAVVVFQKIHFPLGEGGRVDELMVIAAGITGAGAFPRAGIDAQLQPQAVHIIRQIPDSPGEFFPVVAQAAVRPPFLFRPAVVDYHIFISRVLQPGLHHGPGAFPDQFVVDLGCEGIPGIPAQGRRFQYHNNGLSLF